LRLPPNPCPPPVHGVILALPLIHELSFRERLATEGKSQILDLEIGKLNLKVAQT
jgi:hypothetical protein